MAVVWTINNQGRICSVFVLFLGQKPLSFGVVRPKMASRPEPARPRGGFRCDI